MSKLQVGITSAIAVAGATGLVVQAQNNHRLRREIAALAEPQKSIAALRAENQPLAAAATEAELLQRDDLEFRRLAEQIATAQTAKTEGDRLARARAAAQTRDQQVQAEIDRMNREGNALVEQYKAFTARSKDSTLTAAERAQADSNARQKLEEIKAKQREIQTFIAANGGVRSPGAQYRSLETARSAAVNGEISAVGASSGGDEPVTLRLPDADLATLFSALRTFGIKVAPDPSIAGIQRPVTVQANARNRQEAIQVVQAALRDQLDIVLVPAGDGTFVAKRAAPR